MGPEVPPVLRARAALPAPGLAAACSTSGRLGSRASALPAMGLLWAAAIYSDSSLNLFDSTFTTDSADSGGAVYNDLSGTLTVDGSTFTGDTATGSGGAIDSLGTLTVTDGSTFTSDTASLTGGAIGVAAGQANISDSTFTGNSATDRRRHRGRGHADGLRFQPLGQFSYRR